MSCADDIRFAWLDAIMWRLFPQRSFELRCAFVDRYGHEETPS